MRATATVSFAALVTTIRPKAIAPAGTQAFQP